MIMIVHLKYHHRYSIEKMFDKPMQTFLVNEFSFVFFVETRTFIQ